MWSLPRAMASNLPHGLPNVDNLSATTSTPSAPRPTSKPPQSSSWNSCIIHCLGASELPHSQTDEPRLRPTWAFPAGSQAAAIGAHCCCQQLQVSEVVLHHWPAGMEGCILAPPMHAAESDKRGELFLLRLRNHGSYSTVLHSCPASITAPSSRSHVSGAVHFFQG